MMYQDYQLGIGFGRDGSGIIIPVELKCLKSTFELGYKPKKEGWQYLKNKKREMHLTPTVPMVESPHPIPHI